MKNGPEVKKCHLLKKSGQKVKKIALGENLLLGRGNSYIY